MRKKTIRISWQYPILLDDVSESSFKDCKGIYAISRKWGEKTSDAREENLLYIGKTERNFEQRMLEHQQFKLADTRGNIYVRFGIIKKDISSEILDDIESALIYELQPKMNDSKMQSYRYKSNYYVYIINYGFRGVGLIDKVIDAKTHLNEGE